jgi:hypothetical protein
MDSVAAIGGRPVTVSEKDATKMAMDALKNSSMDLSTAEGRTEFENLKRYFLEQGRRSWGA